MNAFAALRGLAARTVAARTPASSVSALAAPAPVFSWRSNADAAGARLVELVRDPSNITPAEHALPEVAAMAARFGGERTHSGPPGETFWDYVQAIAKRIARERRARPTGARRRVPEGVPPLWSAFGEPSTLQCSWCGAQREANGEIRVPDPDITCPRCPIRTGLPVAQGPEIPAYLNTLFDTDPDLARQQLEVMRGNDPPRFAAVLGQILNGPPLRQRAKWLTWARRQAEAAGLLPTAAATAPKAPEVAPLAALRALAARARPAAPPPPAAPAPIVPAPASIGPASAALVPRRLTPTQTVTRREAAEMVAAQLRDRGYVARVYAPADSGVVRVDVQRGEEERGRVYVLLDGRLRAVAADSRYRHREQDAELEEAANDAIAGLLVRPEAPAPDTKIGGLTLEQDELGGYGFGWSENRYTSRADAERYARAVAEQHPEGPVPIAVPPDVPSSRTTAAGVVHLPREDRPASVVVHYDLAAARISHWAMGAPIVRVPFALRYPDGTPVTWPDDGSPVRGEIIGDESIDREDPGHFDYLRRWDGRDAPAHRMDDDERAVHHPVLARLIRAVPPHDVGFDGARVEVTPGEMRVRLDEDPDDRVLSVLRKGKFRKAKKELRVWVRECDGANCREDPIAWWWARRAAWRVQAARKNGRVWSDPPESREVRSHQHYGARERLEAARSAINSAESQARATFREDLRKLGSSDIVDALEARLARLVRLREEYDDLRAVYRDDGSLRPASEPAPHAQDWKQAFGPAFSRIAHGVDIAERDGRIVVRLAEEPAEDFEHTLKYNGFTRSRRAGEGLWWAQPVTGLGRYFAHELAERARRRDEDERAERYRGRFKTPLADDQAWMPDANAVAALAGPVLVVTQSVTALDRVLRVAVGGKDLAAWEAEALEELDRHEEQKEVGEAAIRTARGWLAVASGRIVEDDWLDAYRHALHTTDRRVLIAARLYADQPLVAAAAAYAASAPPPDTLSLNDLARIVPAAGGTQARRRTAASLLHALVHLGVAEEEKEDPRYRSHRNHLPLDGLRRRTPPRVAPAWGWLLRHELIRDGRTEMARDDALRRSLATRLLGYGENAAAWALERAARQGWIELDANTVRLPPAAKLLEAPP